MTDAAFEGVTQDQAESLSRQNEASIASKNGRSWIDAFKNKLHISPQIKTQMVSTQQEDVAILRTRDRLRMEKYRQGEADRSVRFAIGMKIAREIRNEHIKDKIREGE